MKNLEEKQKNKEDITIKDLIPLVLCPLMGGKSFHKNRINKSYKIIKNTTTVEKNKKDKIEAMLYAMADKFLEAAELEKLKEEIAMTRLGQMIWEDGVAEGELRGKTEILTRQIKIKLEKGKSVEEIAEALEENPETIKELMEKL